MKKKLKGNTLVGVIVTILIVAIIIFVLWKLGILNFKGFGNGGDGEAVPAMQSTVAETTEETTVTTTVEKTIVDVNIDGEEYLYSNNSYSLDNLMAEISKIEGEVEVHISLSDTATLAAREALEARLDEKNILHEIVEETEQQQ